MLGALVLLAAGCGGGSEPAGPTETVTVSVAASAEPSDGDRTPGASAPARSTSPTGSATGSASASASASTDDTVPDVDLVLSMDAPPSSVYAHHGPNSTATSSAGYSGDLSPPGYHVRLTGAINGGIAEDTEAGVIASTGTYSAPAEGYYNIHWRASWDGQLTEPGGLIDDVNAKISISFSGGQFTFDDHVIYADSQRNATVPLVGSREGDVVSHLTEGEPYSIQFNNFCSIDTAGLGAGTACSVDVTLEQLTVSYLGESR